MNTVSNLASIVLISENKALEKFDIKSPSVDNSSSALTIESTTEQISSKSLPLINRLLFKDSSKFSSLSETTATNCTKELNTKNLLTSPISSGTRSPIGSPLRTFFNETYQGNKQQFPQNENSLRYRCENMLSTSSNSNQPLPLTTTGRTTPLQPNNASSPTNSIKHIKCEPFATLSPLNESASSQSILDETANCNTGGCTTITMDSNVKWERDGNTTSTTSSTSIMRQNSNSSIKSCPNIVNASSPNDGSDHSNSSNISTNLSQTMDGGTTDIAQDLNISEKSGNKKKSNINSLAVVKQEEAGVKPNVDKSVGLSGSSTKNLICTSLNTMPSVKEETGVMSNLINVKKEDAIISPDISPAAFCSISNLSVKSSVDIRSCTPGKIDDIIKTIPNCNTNNSNNNNEKLVPIQSSISNNGPISCTEDSHVVMVTGSTSVIGNSSNEPCIGSTHNSAVNTISNINSAVGSTANCMEYMQQQNHIFVFSTQLANKGAESVLSGQVPTIIAYHCTQPATKNFLEDFFMKNPMKISKLHRQNTLNLCNISVGAGGQQWFGCNSLPKMSQKHIGNKMNFSAMTGALENKVSLRQSNIPNFAEVSDSLGGNENGIMCWEQTRNNLEGASNESHTGLKMADDVDPGIGEGSHSSNKSHGGTDTSVVNDSGTPSLQGIKVPDENLTPQQRQHREEQLAKLKQIDQFLSNPLQGASQLGKLNADGVPGNLASLMLNLPNSGSSNMGSQINSQLNHNIRNMSPNVINSNICNPEMSATMCDGNIVSPDMLSGHEINNVASNPNKAIHINNQSTIPCGPNGVVVNIASNVSVGSSLPCHTAVNNKGDGAGSGTGGLMPSSPEIVGNFIGEGNSAGKVMSSGEIHSQEMAQVGMAPMGWSKLQHQFFDERIKGNKGQGPNNIGCLSAELCRSNSANMGNTNMRPIIAATCTLASTTNSQVIRSAQGPPPPYHPTQRSASVPIATQSPNPASPNNPTSNLSLPSPRTSGALGIPANSPNLDVHVSSMSTTQAVTMTSTVSTAISNANGHAKINFQTEGSPSSTGTCNSTSMVNNNTNRNRNNQINQFNSNPSTPLSNLSPKDIESFSTSVPAGDLKTARPSPQRSRTPLMGPNNGNITEANNMEGRFPSSSPGLTFPQHLNNTSNSAVNAYKGGPTELQNSAPTSSQFCRRSDNLPLNPNSNRSAQNKLNHSFDPISSLAQMSQQLTSCVSLNSGGVVNTGGVGVIGVNDVNVTNNLNQNIDNMMSSMDSGLDHCNAGSPGMGMLPHMSGTGPFVTSNCHISSMLGPMGQRLLNPKMCGGFNHTSGSMSRDGPGGLHGVMPSHRMMGRMAMNFGNFNMSPNIQVKASTPNTIQYMPVRPQNNNNSNMRVPPSLEFLRYANSQMTTTTNIMDSSHMGQVSTGAASDIGKLNNCNNGPPGTGNSGMSFFGNCNHMGSMEDDQEDIAGGNLLSSHELNLAPHSSMVRGMRPMRQHQHMGNQIIPGPRVQNPGVAVLPGHFQNGPQDPMECGDNSMFIANNSNSSGSIQGPTQTGINAQSQMYSGGNGQQKSVKPIDPNNICQNRNNPNVANNGQITANTNLLSNEHNPSLQSPVNGSLMMANNSNMLSNTMHVGNSTSPPGCGSNGGNGPGDLGNVGYKPFVGPTSNDVKYAQQYHSFQQQLYATSTRGQQNPNTNIGSNVSTNPTYFVNK